MPWTRELAQLPTPAMARRILLMSCSSWNGAGPAAEAERVRSPSMRSSSQARSLARLVGVALAERTEVGVGPCRGAVVPAPASVVAPAEELGPAALEQREAGCVGELAAERDPQRRRSGRRRRRDRDEQLEEPGPPDVGDAVDLLAPAACP